MGLPALLPSKIEANFLEIGNQLRISFSDTDTQTGMEAAGLPPIVVQNIVRDYFWNAIILSINRVQASDISINTDGYTKSVESDYIPNGQGDKLNGTPYLYKFVPVFDGNQIGKLPDVFEVAIVPGADNSEIVISMTMANARDEWNPRHTAWDIYRATGLTGAYYKILRINCIGEDDVLLAYADDAIVGQEDYISLNTNTKDVDTDTSVLNLWQDYLVTDVMTNQIVKISGTYLYLNNGYSILVNNISALSLAQYSTFHFGELDDWGHENLDYDSGFGISDMLSYTDLYDEYVSSLKALKGVMQNGGTSTKFKKNIQLFISGHGATAYYFQLWVYAENASTVETDGSWRMLFALQQNSPSETVYFHPNGTTEYDGGATEYDWFVPHGKWTKIWGEYTWDGVGTPYQIELAIRSESGNPSFYITNVLFCKESEYIGDVRHMVRGANSIISPSFQFSNDEKVNSRVLLGLPGVGNDSPGSKIYKIERNNYNAIVPYEVPAFASSLIGLSRKAYVCDNYIWQGDFNGGATLNIYDDILLDGDLHPTDITSISQNYEQAISHNSRLWGFVVAIENDAGETERHSNMGVFSEIDQPDVLPSNNIINFDDGDANSDDIVKAISLGEYIAILKKLSTSVYYFNKVDPLTNEVHDFAKIPCINKNAVIVTPYGTFFASESGIYIIGLDGFIKRTPVSYPIEDIYRATVDKTNISAGYMPELKIVYFAINGGGIASGCDMYGLMVETINKTPKWLKVVWGNQVSEDV